jgi:hypothetical protein
MNEWMNVFTKREEEEEEEVGGSGMNEWMSWQREKKKKKKKKWGSGMNEFVHKGETGENGDQDFLRESQREIAW